METNKRARAIGFIRVSTDKQENSLEVQERAIRNHCEYHNIELVDLAVDFGVSASKKDFYSRSSGIKLKEYIDKKMVDAVVAVKLDRLFRNTLDALTVVKGWEKNNIAIQILDMGGASVDTSTTNGKFVFALWANIAEMESNRIGDRVRDVAKNRKNNLLAYSKTPYGFKGEVDNNAGPQKNRSGKKIVLKPVDEELEEVKRIFQFAKRGISKPQIAKALNLDNYKRGVSKRWYPSTITYVLKNNIYSNYI